MIIPRLVLLRMRNISDKMCRENQNTHTRMLCPVTFFQKWWRQWDNVEKYSTAEQARVDIMAHAHCMLITKATNKLSQYAILIVFPLQKGLHERTSTLRHTYPAVLLCYKEISNYVQIPYMLNLSDINQISHRRLHDHSKSLQQHEA